MGRVTTATRHYSLPDLDEPDNVPGDLKTLADAIDTDMNTATTLANATYTGDANVWPGESIRMGNGVQICRYTGPISDMAIDSVYGTLFTGYITWTFPQAFTGRYPAVCCGRLQWGTSASWGVVGTVSTTSAMMRAIDVQSRARGAATASFLAYGRWK